MVDPGEQGLYERINTQKTSYMANFGFNYKKRWGSNEVEAIVLAEFNKYSTNYDGFTGYGLIPGLENTPGELHPELRTIILFQNKWWCFRKYISVPTRNA